MKNKFYFLVCLLLTQVAIKAQMKIGDNPTNINGASLLELETTNKGLVFPRISLTGVSSPAPLPAGLLTGTVVFNTNASVTGGNGVGLYVWSGTVWTPVISTAGLPAWNLTGNTGTSYSSNFIGTTDNISFRVRTNNIQRMMIDSLGDVAIGSTAFNPNNRERLLVDYGTTTSHTVANFKGSIDSYLQMNMQNLSNGVNASTDYVATADDGTDSTYFVDMGINSSTYAPSAENWGNAHDAYLYSNSKNLLMGTQTLNADVVFLLGGGRIRPNAVLRLSGPSGNVVVGKGDATDTPLGNIVRGPNGNGTNIPGGGLTLQGGAGTGTAAGGTLNLYGGTTVAGLQGDVNIQGQNIKAKLRKGGSFLILNDSTPGNELVKLLIKETGEVNWYLDKQQFFIRDGFFNAFGNGTLYKYDFMHIDGLTGRIGFNILNGYSDGTSGGQTNLPLTSSVTLLGSIATKVRFLQGNDSNYQIKQDDHIMIIDAPSGKTINMILSPVATSLGREYIFKRNENKSNNIIVQAAPGEKLNGNVNGSVTLGTDNSSLDVVCGPDSWWVISEISVKALAEITTTSKAYTPNKDDKTILADASSASFTITLPGAAAVEAGQTYIIKRTNAGANTVIVAGNGSETMDGIPSLRLNQRFDYLQLESDGANWMVISERISPSLVVNPTLPYAATAYDGTISSNGNGTINLPSTAAVLGGKIFTIKNSATAGNPTLTVHPNGSQTVDGLATWPLLKGQFVTIQSDGTNWIVIGQ